MPTTTPLTTLALARAAQPPTGTCPTNLQAILLWVALRRVEQALAAHTPVICSNCLGAHNPDLCPGHMSQNKTLITPTPTDSCRPAA